MANDKWLQVGTIRKSKDGKLYMKLSEDVDLKKDDVLQIQDPRKRLDMFAETGKITAEVAAERKAKIPEYIRHEVILPPKRS